MKAWVYRKLRDMTKMGLVTKLKLATATVYFVNHPELDDLSFKISFPDKIRPGHEAYAIAQWTVVDTGARYHPTLPAVVFYRSDGSIMEEQYFSGLRFGQLHRSSGPAIITYKKDGTVDITGYYLNGEMVSEKKFHKMRSRARRRRRQGLERPGRAES